MPCLVITGHPCSGKSTFSRQLRDHIQNNLSKYATAPYHIERVVIIQDEDFFDEFLSDNPKAACYQDSQSEKKIRGAIKSSFDRALVTASTRLPDDGEPHHQQQNGSNTLVVVDSLNYIKGFRYELHCISKASKERHGVVWILNDIEQCKNWNRERRRTRQQASAPSLNKVIDFDYTDAQMDELLLRYEAPDARNRWDQPLYRVNMRPSATGPNSSSSATAESVLQQSVYDMHKLSNVIGQQNDCNIGTKQQTVKPRKSAFKRKQKPVASDASRLDTASAASEAQTSGEGKAKAEPPHVGTKDPTIVTETSHGEKPPPTLEQRIDELLDSFLLSVKPLKEGISTRQNAMTDPDVLHNVDSITQRLCSSINMAQNKATSKELVIGMPDGSTSLKLDSFSRQLSLAELRGIRRQFIQWFQSYPPEDSSEAGIAKAFLAFVEAQTS